MFIDILDGKTEIMEPIFMFRVVFFILCPIDWSVIYDWFIIFGSFKVDTITV